MRSFMKNIILKKLLYLALILGLLSCQSASNKNSGTSQAGFKTFTQKWDTRGGTTESLPSPASSIKNPYFEKIKNKSAKKQKDRMAILALTGEYEVHFEFMETLFFAKPLEIDNRPYYSWATEYIFPIANEEDFISLQHILVMRHLDEKGNESEPIVVKHWRQDWQYQDPVILEYKGNKNGPKTWKKRRYTDRRVSGSWSQTVYQVDDSLRYKTYGRWEHQNNSSRWTSYRVNRPLARREFSIRDDYHMLSGIHMLTVTDSGWYHEQYNEKLKVTDNEEKRTLVAKEIGLNQYRQIEGFDFTAGRNYWERTKDYWREVRKVWNELINESNTIQLKDQFKDKRLHEIHFEFAERLMKDHDFDKEDFSIHARKTIEKFIQAPVKKGY